MPWCESSMCLHELPFLHPCLVPRLALVVQLSCPCGDARRNATVVLVERSSQRNKVDPKMIDKGAQDLRSAASFARIRIDIAHLNLGLVSRRPLLCCWPSRAVHVPISGEVLVHARATACVFEQAPYLAFVSGRFPPSRSNGW